MQGTRLALYLEGVGFEDRVTSCTFMAVADFATKEQDRLECGLGFPSCIVPILEILRCHSLCTRSAVLKGMNFAVA